VVLRKIAYCSCKISSILVVNGAVNIFYGFIVELF
jgi:hypothetical protein